MHEVELSSLVVGSGCLGRDGKRGQQGFAGPGGKARKLAHPREMHRVIPAFYAVIAVAAQQHYRIRVPT